MARLWTTDASGALDECKLHERVWMGPGFQLCRAAGPMDDQWVLVGEGGQQVLINGRPLSVGLRVLINRDEIRGNDGTRVVFSDERTACVVRFPLMAGRVQCARCTGEFEPEEAAVQCPSCRCWYHEHGDYLCWTSVPFCQVCGAETGLNRDLRWVPDVA